MIDKRLLKEARQTRYYLGLTVFLSIVSSCLIVLQAGLFARVLNRVFIEKGGLCDVWTMLGLLLLVFLLRAVLTWGSELFAHRTAARIKADLRKRLLTQIFALGPVRIKGESTGELTNVLLEGVEALEAYFARYLPQLVLAAMVPLFFLAFIFPVDVLSGWIMLFTAPLIPLFMVLIGKWADSLSRKQWESLSRMSAHFFDVLQGLTTLKIFGRSKTQAEVIARVSDRFRQTTLGVLRVAFLSALTLELLTTLSTALVAVALGLRLVYGHIFFEQAMFILLLAPEFYFPLRQLGVQFHSGMAGVSAAERIFEILDMEYESGQEILPANNVKLGEIRISWHNVHYTYGREGEILKGVSFDLCPGEIVVLVGASGTGKSTIANLLLGILKPTEGQIIMAGREKEIPICPQNIALVPQHAHLFSGTIAENIRFGRPDAAEEEVIRAASLAGAGDFIDRLPQGYNTRVGEGGMTLSGGQIQRIALARAFLKDAPVLVLDEATSGLDRESENLIQESLEKLRPGRIILVIAHRLTLAARADRILVLDQGKIAEQGKHQELLNRQGVYYKLVEAYGGMICESF